MLYGPTPPAGTFSLGSPTFSLPMGDTDAPADSAVEPPAQKSGGGMPWWIVPAAIATFIFVARGKVGRR